MPLRHHGLSMGNIFAQEGHYSWLINMVGTAQMIRISAEVKEIMSKMEHGKYESKLFQHITKPLCFVEWSDNNITKTLSNFHLHTVCCKINSKFHTHGIFAQPLDGVRLPFFFRRWALIRGTV